MTKEMTIGELYKPAMKINDQAEADAYFEKLVERCMSFGYSRADSERMERYNLGYYAGYYSSETEARVQRLFRCQHPVHGKVAGQNPHSDSTTTEEGRV